MLATAGVSELVRVKLARHTTWKQTDGYTDPKSLPLFLEIEKLTSALPSSIASLKFGKSCQNEGKSVQSAEILDGSENAKISVPERENPVLTSVVPRSENAKAGGEGGIRTPGRLPYARFPSGYFKPLSHLSVTGLRGELRENSVPRSTEIPDVRHPGI